MAFLNVKNNASSVLASSISAAATSLTVAVGEGARFPASNFNITIEGEILLCTSRSGDVLTVTRAQEGTVAAAHAADKSVRLNITAAIITELQQTLSVINKSCRVSSSVAQSIPNATSVAESFNIVRWDTDGIFDAANPTRLTCKTAGKYIIIGNLAMAGPGNGYQFGINILYTRPGVGSAWIGGQVFPSGTFNVYLAISTVYDLAVNDYVELCYWQSTGSNVNSIISGNRSPEFVMARIA